MRSGWVYGTLMLPFNCRPGDQTIHNDVAVGPYMGARVDAGNKPWIALQQPVGQQLCQHLAAGAFTQAVFQGRQVQHLAMKLT
jgi:hypothetical protein